MQPSPDDMATRPLHPRHGPHNPVTGTPPRRPRSVRRTTTHDSARPDGLLGDVVIDGRGRDLWTNADGHPVVLDTATLHTRVRYMSNREVVSITVHPPAPGIEGLLGTRASSGFRLAVDEVLPNERDSGSLRFQLLDDVPTATLVSGFAIGAGGAKHGKVSPHPDLCAGWATGASILAEMDVTGMPPQVTGPETRPLARRDDPHAWHTTRPLPPHAMRRHRRVDLWEEGDIVSVDAFFRDTHMGTDKVETVIHEYSVRATVDPTAERFLSCQATVGVLPWMECPAAAASAERLAGAPIHGLRRWVRDTFVGPTTCTHLNDTLRALEDVPALWRMAQATPE
jgi:hypothetical protein